MEFEKVNCLPAAQDGAEEEGRQGCRWKSPAQQCAENTLCGRTTRGKSSVAGLLGAAFIWTNGHGCPAGRPERCSP